MVQAPVPGRGHVLVRPAQVRLTSDFDMPVPVPRAWTSSSTARVEAPCVRRPP